MEPASTLLQGERNFFSQEPDFMPHLLANFPTNVEAASAFCPHHQPTINTHKSISDNTSDGNSVLFPTSIAHSRGSQNSIYVLPKITLIGEEGTQLSAAEPNYRKRSCSLADGCTSWKKTKFSKSHKRADYDYDVVYRRITSMHDSDDDLNGLQDVSPMLNSNGKKRASMGSATENQSVYAKKRREKINERLRILQNLVPNGTKVDISTMLEEAVEYVKFLQLQIKLLSSDDLWMYAPIAYNGMDIRIDMKLPSPR